MAYPRCLPDRHPAADDPTVTLVYVTHYMMWDNGATPSRVIEHSVAIDSALRYNGYRRAGIAVVNELQRQ